MPVRNAARVLQIWESASTEPAVRMGLELLAMTGEDASRLTIGAFDARLLRLRGGMFGPVMQAAATCPSCGNRLELEVDTARLPVHADDRQVREGFEIDVDGYHILCRLPQAGDAREAALCNGPAEARSLLLRRCVTQARRDGATVPPEELPDSVCLAIGERMAAEDPEALLSLAVECPCCLHSWEAPLDVAAYLAREVGAWALRLLSDVHALASRYGWSEREILEMSPKRRAIYMRMGDA